MQLMPNLTHRPHLGRALSHPDLRERHAPQAKGTGPYALISVTPRESCRPEVNLSVAIVVNVVFG